MPFEIALLTERTVLAFQAAGVADRGGGTFRALGDWGSGIDQKLLTATQTQVRGVKNFAREDAAKVRQKVQQKSSELITDLL